MYFMQSTSTVFRCLSFSGVFCMRGDAGVCKSAKLQLTCDPHLFSSAWLSLQGSVPQPVGACCAVAKKGLNVHVLGPCYHLFRTFYQYCRTRRWRKSQNRKPIGELGCCESRMAERIHWCWSCVFWSGYNGCSGHLVGHLTHNCWM